MQGEQAERGVDLFGQAQGLYQLGDHAHAAVSHRSSALRQLVHDVGPPEHRAGEVGGNGSPSSAGRLSAPQPPAWPEGVACSPRPVRQCAPSPSYASSRNALLLYGDLVFGDSIFAYQEGVFADPGPPSGRLGPHRCRSPETRAPARVTSAGNPYGTRMILPSKPLASGHHAWFRFSRGVAV